MIQLKWTILSQFVRFESESGKRKNGRETKKEPESKQDIL